VRSREEMKTNELMICNRLGLHARAAAKVVHTASSFAADVFIGNNDEEVNAKSILGLLTLAATKGTTLSIRADGEDEEQAVAALVRLFRERFGEPE